MSTLGSKSWRDLRRRPARAISTIATVALAVAGLWIFAMPTLMTDAMNDRIRADHLYDVHLTTTDVVLRAAQLSALQRTPGVIALDARTVYKTTLVAGAQRREVVLVGVSHQSDQQVNTINVSEGDAPVGNQVLADRMDSLTGRYSGRTGDRVAIEDRRGHPRPFTVAGQGGTMAFSMLAQQQVVLYAPQATVNDLAHASGVNSIEVRVQDPERAASVAADVRARLLRMRPEVTFPDLVDVRKTGVWPGQEIFDNVVALLYLGAALAFISALVLISNTMTTLVAEQRREIAIMKAIGGRRRQIRRSYLRTSLILGATGTLFGIGLGIPFTNLALGFIGNRFFAVTPRWGVPASAVAVSVVVGVGVTLLASLPALRTAARTSVRAGFESGLGGGGGGRLDRALRRLRLARPEQIGIRSATRHPARTLATLVQVTLAVSVALGFLALGVTVGNQTTRVWDAMRWDIIVKQKADVPLDGTAGRLIATTPGVRSVEPVLQNTLTVGGDQYEAWGVQPQTTMFVSDIRAGRWLDTTADTQRRSVVVLGRALANKLGTHLGDTLAVGAARGPARLKVIGVDNSLLNGGTILYLPLATFQHLLGRSVTNAYWVTSQGHHETAIDRLAAAEVQRLTAAGYPVETQARYVERAADFQTSRVIIAVLTAMGVPLVLISMIGLLNSMTMNVFERTREVGMLRCIGASSRTVRRIFRAEAIGVAFVGAVIAIAGGWLVGALLASIVTDLFHYGSVPYAFPWGSAALAVVTTLALAWLIVIAPLRRAARLKPSEALRYE